MLGSERYYDGINIFSVTRPYAFSALTRLLCPSSESSVIKLRRNSLEHESIP